MLVPKVQDLAIATTATNTTMVLVENFKNMMLYVPAVVSKFAAGSVEISILGAYSAATGALPMNVYDYPNLQVASAKITATTAGFYELPFPGSVPYIQFSVNTTATQAATLRLVYND
jgi:hypothetical protein